MDTFIKSLFVVVIFANICITIYWSIIATREYNKPIEEYLNKTLPKFDWVSTLLMLIFPVMLNILSISCYDESKPFNTIALLLFINGFSLMLIHMMKNFSIGLGYMTVSLLEYDAHKQIKVDSVGE